MEIKYLRVFEELKRQIEEQRYAYRSLIPTETELCREFGVSRIAVRMAVEKLCGIGYLVKKQGFGTYVNVNIPVHIKHTIGLVISSIASSFGTDILLGLESEANAHNYHLLFKNSDNSAERELECLKQLLDYPVEGVVMQPIHNEKSCPLLQEFLEKKIPVVLIDRDLPDMDLSFVGTDSILETCKSVESIFRMGKKRICLITQSPVSATSISERHRGFKMAYKRSHILFNARYIFTDICSLEHYSYQNYCRDKSKILEYLRQNEDIDCIIAGEIGIAKIVSDVIEENEFLADRTIVTFDKSETSLRKGTFYIIQNQFEMGKTAFELLLRHIEAAIPSQKIFLSTKFMQI